MKRIHVIQLFDISYVEMIEDFFNKHDVRHWEVAQTRNSGSWMIIEYDDHISEVK